MMEMLNRNLPAKIIALIVAIVLWFFVMSEQNPAIENNFTVPLEVHNVTEGYTLNYKKDSVKIKVKAPRSMFAMASDKEFRAFMDLSGLEEGKHAVKVQTILPQGFELVTVSPETVMVEIDKIIEKDIRVDIAFSGTPESGVTVGSAVPERGVVVVEGPRSEIETVSRVVGYINLSGIDSDFTVDAPLVAVNIDGKEVANVKIDPPTVKISASIVKGLYKKTVDLKPSIGDDLPVGLEITSIKLDPATVEIYGDQRLVDNIDFLYTEKISLADIVSAKHRQVKLELPIGVNTTNSVVNAYIEYEKKQLGNADDNTNAAGNKQ